MTRRSPPGPAHTAVAPVAGFTLLEMIVVLVLIGSTLAIVLPSGNRSTGKPALETAAIRLAATLRLAHAEAIRTNQDQFVIFAPDQRSYRAPATHTHERLANGVALTIEHDGLEWDGSARLVRFRPDGTATGAVFALDHSAGRARVTVDALTGIATVGTDH